MVVRLIRIVRIARLARLMRLRIFRELLLMLKGLVGLLRTLACAICLLFLTVYFLAIILVQVIGSMELDRQMMDGQDLLFQNVGASMFTVFRCSFGECSTIKGTPIFEHIIASGGFLAVSCGCVYSCFIFFVQVGAFNVISAVLFENICKFEAKHDQEKLAKRLNDKALYSRSFTKVLRRILKHPTSVDAHKRFASNMLEHAQDLSEVRIPRSIIDEVVKNDGEAKDALNALDIDPVDQRKLSKILDSSHSGSVGVIELMNGLVRLRGMPRRSDTVSAELVATVSLEKLDDIFGILQDIASSQRQALEEGRDFRHEEERDGLLRVNAVNMGRGFGEPRH